MLVDAGLGLPNREADAATRRAFAKETATAWRDGIAQERRRIVVRLDAAAAELAETMARHETAATPVAAAVVAAELAIIGPAHDKLAARLAHIDAEHTRACRLSDSKLAAERGRG
jgi:hypothetical protein